MKTFNAYTDDDGQKWEFLYDDRRHREEVEGQTVEVTVVEDFRYRREGDEEWLSLPPWATVRDAEKITLCFFDEDDEGEMTFWEVAP